MMFNKIKSLLVISGFVALLVSCSDNSSSSKVEDETKNVDATSKTEAKKVVKDQVNNNSTVSSKEKDLPFN